MSTPPAQKSKSEPTRSPKRGNRRGGAYRTPPSRKKVMESKPEVHVSPKGSPVLPLPNAEGVEQSADTVELASESIDVCWICTEPVKYYAISECNHRTCHVCALRLRALYKKTECTFCKESFLLEKQISVIYTKSPDATYASFNLEDLPLKDSKLSIYFETQEMMEDSLLLLRFNCPEQECDYIAHGWGDLRLHVRASHGKFMCDLCIRSKKVFCHEHILYPPGTLPVHLPSMHARPSKSASKAAVEGGVHPLCEFCRECFFGDDELYAHLRERHEECFVCKRNGLLQQYFSNYEALERHFNTAHHPCTRPDCLARKFVVFDTPIDLKAHMMEDHGADMSSKDKKDARRIQTNFTFEGTSAGNHHGRREREPPSTQLPQQQSQSLANPPGRPPPTSRRRDAFGGALTEPGVAQSYPNNRENRPNSPPTESDSAVDEKQAALIERLESLAPNPSAAVAAIKAATRSYRLVESNARDLILTVWTVMDSHLEHTASIVNALVDTLDGEEKKQEVLSSWKGFVVEQKRQFPELGPTSMGSDYAGIASGRVLNAKHATSARSSQSVWNRVAMAASSSTLPPPRPQSRFPPLGGRSVAQRSTPWSNSSMPSPAPQAPNLSQSGINKTPPLSSAQFPELPPSSAARTRVPVSGNVSLMNILGNSGTPVTSAWSGNSPASGGTTTIIEPASRTQSPDELALGRKKKKGKQKQTLFTLGSFPTQ